MRKLIMGLLLITIIMLMGMTVQAKETTRYTTQTVTLRSSRDGKALKEIKRNNKVKLVKEGKYWSRVTYKGDLYKVEKKYLHEKKSPKVYTARQFRQRGVIRWGGKKWTWYTQRILPGYGLHIPGRHLDKNGFVCDKDDYIVVAITRSARKSRLVVPTPFGKYGKCYDCGGGGSAWRDVYCNW